MYYNLIPLNDCVDETISRCQSKFGRLNYFASLIFNWELINNTVIMIARDLAQKKYTLYYINILLCVYSKSL